MPRTVYRRGLCIATRPYEQDANPEKKVKSICQKYRNNIEKKWYGLPCSMSAVAETKYGRNSAAQEGFKNLFALFRCFSLYFCCFLCYISFLFCPVCLRTVEGTALIIVCLDSLFYYSNMT